MPEYYPLRNGVAEARGRCDGPLHPGLLLDVFVPHRHIAFDSFDQGQDQEPHLERIRDASQEFGNLHGDGLLQRWDNIRAASDLDWELTTVWRLAAHLSRPTAMENAALCLHPVYGFPYLPGSGLKGVALTYARSNAAATDWQRIMGTGSAGGAVAFLEAWPRCWPSLEVDITNNHHPEYYRTRGAIAPGDWESPIPVYFLTVAPNTTFRFALRKAHPMVSQNDLALAKTWLIGGLTELGFGAKTAAGYGYFAEVGPAYQRGAGPVNALQDPMVPFRQWVTVCCKSNDPARVVREGLDGKLKSLPPEKWEEAKAYLLDALSESCPAVLKLSKKDKTKSRPSLADRIRKCSPSQ